MLATRVVAFESALVGAREIDIPGYDDVELIPGADFQCRSDLQSIAQVFGECVRRGIRELTRQIDGYVGAIAVCRVLYQRLSRGIDDRNQQGIGECTQEMGIHLVLESGHSPAVVTLHGADVQCFSVLKDQSIPDDHETFLPELRIRIVLAE